MTEVISYADTFALPPIIGLTGLIAVGKTTLARNLSAALGWKMVPEVMRQNPYLDMFYKSPDGMSRWAFSSQVRILNKRLERYQAALSTRQPAILDRTIYDDPIFALTLRRAGHITAADFETYVMCYRNLVSAVRKPDLIMYLDVTPERAHERLVRRGRACEQSITLDYLRNLRAGYEEWFRSGVAGVPTVRVDWNEFGGVEVAIECINTQMGAHLRRGGSVVVGADDDIESEDDNHI